MAEFNVLIDGPKYALLGMLSILWWDVRKIRDVKAIFAKTKTEILKEVDDNYVDKDTHELLDKNVHLTVEVMIGDSEKRIIKAIEDNGK